MFCPKCGTKSEDDAAFCGNCGESLKRAEANKAMPNSGAVDKNPKIKMVVIGVVVLAVVVAIALIAAGAFGAAGSSSGSSSSQPKMSEEDKAMAQEAAAEQISGNWYVGNDESTSPLADCRKYDTITISSDHTFSASVQITNNVGDDIAVKEISGNWEFTTFNSPDSFMVHLDFPMSQLAPYNVSQSSGDEIKGDGTISMTFGSYGSSKCSIMSEFGMNNKARIWWDMYAFRSSSDAVASLR